MKNFTTTKKSIFAIIISLVIVLFAVILTTCLSVETSLPNQQLYTEPYSNDGLGTAMFAETIEGVNKDAYIMKKEFAACTMAAVIYQNKSDVYEVVDMKPNEEKSSMNIASNLDQSYYNDLLYDKYKITASGTCTLISIIIVTKALGHADKIKTSYRDCVTEEDYNLAMLKELYEISVKYGNDYYKSISQPFGTYTDTIINIINEFYSKHGITSNISELFLDSDLRKNVEKNRKGPAIISFRNAITSEGREVNSHSVALTGSYKISLRYRKRKYGLLIWGDFNAFYICNGWSNGNDYYIGENYQILLFNTDVENIVQLINFK